MPAIVFAAIAFGAWPVAAQSEDEATDSGIPATPIPPPAEALAKPPPGDAALADLYINGSPFGTVDFFLDPEGRTILPAALVRSAFSGLARPEIVASLAAAGEPVTEDALGAFGIVATYDPGELKLSIAVPARIMVPVELGQSQRPRLGLSGESALKNARYAATVGVSAEIAPDYTAAATSTFSPGLRIGISPALRAFDLVAEGDAELAYDGSFSASLNSGRILRDFPGLGARASLGIVSTDSVSFQSSRSLYGASFSRETSVPASYAGGGKKIIDEFVIEKSATVTVLVNGQSLRKLSLGPGSYRLTDLPLSSGLNEVEVKIEEEGEEPRVAKLGLPFDSTILDKGEMDYSATLGADRSDPTEPFGSLSFAMGMGQMLQAGLDAEAGYGIAMGGGTALWASDLGTLGAGAAMALPYSGSEAWTPSYATRLYWRFFRPSERYVPRLGAAIEYRSPRFTAPRSDLASNPPDTLPKWTFSAQASESLPKGISVFALGDFALEAGALGDFSYTLSAMIPLRSYIQLSVSGGADWEMGEEAVPRLSFTLSITPPDRRTINYQQDLMDGSNSLGFSADLDEQGNSSAAISAQGLSAVDTDQSLSLSGRMKTDYVSYAASGRYYRPEGDAYTELSGSVSAESKLVFADGYFGAASSVGDAIAILIPSAATEGERMELRSTGGADLKLGSGSAQVFGGLTPYETFAAAIEMPESSPDRRPDPTAIAFTPAYKSVTLVKVGLASSISVGGRLVDASGGPRKNMAGDILDSSGAALPFGGTFSDDEGVFQCFGLSAGDAAIRWSDGSVSKFRVPEGDSGAYFDIGDVSAEAPTAEVPKAGDASSEGGAP